MICKEELIQKLHNSMETAGTLYDAAAIQTAIDTAIAAHNGQKRVSGEEYICHPLSVALILVELGMDSESIEAALLHDVVEDTDIELSDLEKVFGKEVAALVDGVTKLSKLPFTSKEEQQAENIRKMLLAMAQDIRVIIIKLADRLHNMRTIGALREQKQRDIARETMDIFAPLAHRLGIRAVKEELEDLALRTLDPIGYHEIEDALELRHEQRDAFLSETQEKIRERLQEYGMTPYLSGRIKSIAGIYRKMYMQGRAFEEIYDIYAIRVIVDTDTDCYNVLGVIHDMFRPIPNRFKDYISTPKANMYQSLHTTLIGKESIPFEVQIRTWAMHHTAEYGIAAHWKYKLGLQKKDRLEERLSWIRHFIECQQDVDEPEDIVQSIKTDLSTDEVFALTPKGDVITLPTGGTVIDFAYAIHTAVGNRMVGAKVDGRIVSLDYTVKTGEIVEILTTSAQGHGPSRDWLNIVRTSEARNKIRSWFKKEKREENILRGRTDLEREISRNCIRFSEERLKELLLAYAHKQHFETEDDLYAAIGYGGVILSRLVAHLKEEYQKQADKEKAEAAPLPTEPTPPPRRGHSSSVIIDRTDNCLIKFARCCNPVPGDDIIGFITRGNGVSVHKRGCSNVPTNIAAAQEPERWITVEWEQGIQEEFHASLAIRVSDRVGMLADITAQLAAMRVMIYSVALRNNKNGVAVLGFTINVNSLEHLNFVVSKLKKIPGVYDIERE